MVQKHIVNQEESEKKKESVMGVGRYRPRGQGLKAHDARDERGITVEAESTWEKKLQI